MIRILILLGIGYFGYKILKSWIAGSATKTLSKPPTGRIDDVMVKDPYCHVYFPKREGIRLRVDGEDVYFCSKECRDKFLASRSEKSEKDES